MPIRRTASGRADAGLVRNCAHPATHALEGNGTASATADHRRHDFPSHLAKTAV